MLRSANGSEKRLGGTVADDAPQAAPSEGAASAGAAFELGEVRLERRESVEEFLFFLDGPLLGGVTAWRTMSGVDEPLRLGVEELRVIGELSRPLVDEQTVLGFRGSRRGGR